MIRSKVGWQVTRGWRLIGNWLWLCSSSERRPENNWDRGYLPPAVTVPRIAETSVAYYRHRGESVFGMRHKAHTFHRCTMIAQVSPARFTLRRESTSTAHCVLENHAVVLRQQGKMLAQSYEQRIPGRTQLHVSPFVLTDLHRHFRPAQIDSTFPIVKC